ncbi:hypothetical protein IAT38_004046 [Cryptococcus sp. DSM 104549]
MSSPYRRPSPTPPSRSSPSPPPESIPLSNLPIDIQALEEEAALLAESDGEDGHSRIPSTGQVSGGRSVGVWGWLDGLGVWPTWKDKVGVGLVLAGIALFVPLTWYLVLSGGIKGKAWFAVHPPLQSLALAAFVIGVTPLQPPPPTSQSRPPRLLAHQVIFLALSLPLMILGASTIAWNKHLHSANHLTTWHAKFGALVVLWAVVQAAVGAGSVWFGGKAFGGGDKARKVYKWHRFSGYILITLSLITANLGGFYSFWAQRREVGIPGLLAFWVGLPMMWVGMGLRMRTSKMPIFK